MNSYYRLTATTVRYSPLVDGKGYPVKLVDGKQVPADAAYSKNQAESAKLRAEESMRAARAGEQVQDADIRGQLRTAGEPDDLLVETHEGVMRPDVSAWGVRYEEGQSSRGPC